MADINTRLKQKITGGAYETIHHETKTNLCTHDGNNLETEVGTLKTAVDAGNSLYIDKSDFDIEKVKYASKSIDNEEWINLPLDGSSVGFVYSSGYSVRLKRTSINTLIIEGKFKFKEYPSINTLNYIVLCKLPSNIIEPSPTKAYEIFSMFNKTNGDHNTINATNGWIDFTSREIRLYGTLNKGNWSSSLAKEKEFSFQMEYYYDWI